MITRASEFNGVKKNKKIEVYIWGFYSKAEYTDHCEWEFNL